MVVGKKVTEAIPGIKAANPELFEIYGRVAVSCQNERFEVFFKPLGMWLNVSVYCPRKGYFAAVFEDISERKKAEEELKRQLAIRNGRNKMLQEALSGGTFEALGEICLEVAQELTGSAFGFIGEVNERGLEDIAISNPGWSACVMYDQSGHRRPPGNFKIHGIYGRVLLDGKGFFTNEPASHPDKIGLPQGHPPLKSFIGVPLKNNDKTTGLIALANRKGGYSKTELDSLESLAPVIVEAFSRKRAEEALRDSEQRWATTLASIGDAVIATDTTGKVLFMNSKAEALTGWKQSEASQEPVNTVFKIINEQTRLEAESPIERVLRDGMVVSLANHTVLIQKDGKEIPIDDSAAPIKGRDGKNTGVVLVFRDIAKRRQAEQEHERLSAIVESTDDAVIGKTLDGIITSWNPAAEKLYGYTANEIVGKSVSILIPKERAVNFKKSSTGYIEVRKLDIMIR